ncbi:MAG: 4-alpha-glucanotransferase [Clostridiales Family XIII bacterium]|jgi:4-alpha-glucanotransferase|nr:4-alpha-glucanotransferase [Clostridiales Family XIII bacterium]
MDGVKRRGVLFPLFSLPGPDGIGTIGRPARDFIDFLAQAGQDLWQILPIGPSDETGSPYRVLSAMGGDPLLIDAGELCAAGYISAAELSDYYAAARLREQTGSGHCAAHIDYAHLRALKFPLLETAALRAGRSLNELFFAQWQSLRAYADSCGVGIIGDLPFYVSDESSDYRERPELFGDAFGGVPPDDYSSEGQIWHEPVYRWRAHRETGYAWWRARVAQAAELYTGVRLDHFRGFADYYEIRPGEDASSGTWREGPGEEMIDVFEEVRGGLTLIAEDLGFLSDRARKLREYSGWPGMAVLQFAFEPGAESAYLPHRHTPNTVVYTGTHDNDTLAGWIHDMSARRSDVIEYACEYLGVNGADALPRAMIGAALGSAARTAIIPLQDYLGLGSEARINTPGTTCPANWSFRLADGSLTAELAETMRNYYEKPIDYNS